MADPKHNTRTQPPTRQNLVVCEINDREYPYGLQWPPQPPTRVQGLHIGPGPGYELGQLGAPCEAAKKPESQRPRIACT